MQRIIDFTFTSLFLIPPIVYYLRLQLSGRFISVSRFDYDGIAFALWVVPFIIQTTIGFSTILVDLGYLINFVLIILGIWVFKWFSYKSEARPVLHTKNVEKENLLKTIERTLSEVGFEFNREDNEIVLAGDENISFYVARYPSSKCVVYVYNYGELPEQDVILKNIKNQLEERSGQNSRTMIMPLSMIVVTIAFLGATLFGYLPLKF